MSTELQVDLRAYPLLSIMKAASAMSPYCVIQVAQESETSALLTLRARVDVPPLLDPVAVFLSLLSDLTLQERIAEQTKDIRAALLRAAFHEALSPTK